MITRKSSSETPIKAITGTAPQPGTTFPCPELPMDLSKVPRGVFCPMAILGPQLMLEFRYCMGIAPFGRPPVETLMETTSPAISLILVMLVGLFGLTGFGIYSSFGPPSKKLDDPFDDHDD